MIYLADRAGKVIAKRELIDHVWSDVTVAEGTLRVHVAAIRKALGDGQFGNQYIANIKGRGYSFVGTLVPFAGRGQVPLADLGSLTDPRHFAEAIATSLRFAVNLKLLIVLDNGEQAIEAVTLVAEQLSQETD
ncbi:winged helix-turn-helix domain-containing protein [Bradyrhizobium huanghuaihaiense]|uniref:winged helix-turn-helix domain-containing protein n=1 Tax=Bradyrhizobium huanghuaihaiense TaxID=990078 RepID=UPI0018DBBD09|nr:winged helix-turn-helix domain-containing protein [Bradyrhizobium sp. CB3035]UWU76545.1 winged helix-turn-helix domain-containing protein [Bradyrhizobium sp. CB3035]